jgi:hypothetical protein
MGKATWTVAVILIAGVGYAAQPGAKRAAKPMAKRAPLPAARPTPQPMAKPAAKPVVRTGVFETSARATPDSEIDKIVFPKLASLDIHPALCSDAVFVRRVFLDVIGTLPTSKEAREFLESKNKNKRRQLIERLLEREEFADYWAMKWGDVLRIKAEFPVNLWPNAAQAYHRWVRASIAENKPYNKFARELLTSSGSNFRVGPVNFYRAIQSRTPDGIAGAVALTFMGSRVETWPKERLAGMAAFFSQVGYKPTAEWKEEVVFWDPYNLSKVAGNVAPGKAALVPPKPAPGKPPATPPPAAPPPATVKTPAPFQAVAPDGREVTIPPSRDPRDMFANWLIRPENPWFAKCFVNRVWFWLLGRGIIHEPDDIRDDNPAVYPELLEYLQKEFVDSGYDMKVVYRLILNSRTYQASSLLKAKNPKAEAYFGCCLVRRLDAEVLIDAIDKVTGTTDLYTSAIPEPFTYIPADKPAIAIADGSITSPFLALFGRSARSTGLVNERPTKPLPLQWLHTLNSGHIQNKLETGTWMKTLTASGNESLQEIIDELYLTILSRYPTPEEMTSIMEYLFLTIGGKTGTASYDKSGKPIVPKLNARQKRDNSIDIAWALINSIEFTYRH